MKRLLYAGLVLMVLFVQTSADNYSYKLYVTPDPELCSSNQACVTFTQSVSLLQNIKSHENITITLVFMKGNHTVTASENINFITPLLLHFEDKLVHIHIYVYTRNLTMEGTSTGVIIQDTSMSFKDVYELHIKNLTLINGYFHILMAKEKTQLHLYSITSIDYVFGIEYATQAQITDCIFINGASPLTIRKSNVTFSCNSQFFNNHNSALVSYSSTITLSGTLSFINNTGIRGGAMALYSSTMYLTSGLNISFINNSAEQTGGAIHIEPDMTRSSCPECFYEVSNDDTNITLFYSENLAHYGGDNIYGTSFSIV